MKRKNILFWHDICCNCHFGRLAAPPAILAASPSLGGITAQPHHMISPPPRIGGSMPLPNEPKLSSKCTPINGGWIPLNPLTEPLVGGNSNQEPMVERYHFQPSHPNGDTSSPIAAIASYCERKASTRSRLPGSPTFTIIVSSPPL